MNENDEGLTDRSNTFFYSWLVLGGVFFALTYSLQWILPLTYSWKHGALESFTPIHYSMSETTDNYFYFARIRDVLDGQLFSFDPMIVEHRNVINPHSTYQGAYWLAGITGLFSRSTNISFYFCYLFFPLLAFVGIGLIFHLFFPTAYESLPLTFLVCAAGMFWFPFNLFDHLPPRIPALFDLFRFHNFDTTDYRILSQLRRMPNTLIMAPLCIVTCYLFFRSLIKDRYSLLSASIAGIVLGICALTGSANLLFIYSMLGVLAVLCWKQVKFRRFSIVGFAVSCPFLCYALFLSIQGTTNLQESDYLSFTPQYDPKDIVALIICELASLLIPLLLSGVTRYPYRKIITAAFASALVWYVLIFLRAGNFYAERVIARSGADCVLGVCVSLWLMYLIKDLPTLCRNQRVYTKYTSLVLYSYMLGTLFFNQYSFWSRNPERFILPNYMKLCSWLLDHTSPEDVVLTFDSDLIINLPSCSPASHYIPQAFSSPTPTDERLARFMEAAHFYGVDNAKLNEILVNPFSALERDKDYRTTLLSHWKLILFYGSHYDEGHGNIPEEELRRIFAQFESTDPHTLHFKHDFFIVGPEEKLYGSKDSDASHISAKLPPVAEIGGYRIFTFS